MNIGEYLITITGIMQTILFIASWKISKLEIMRTKGYGDALIDICILVFLTILSITLTSLGGNPANFAMIIIIPTTLSIAVGIGGIIMFSQMRNYLEKKSDGGR